METRHQLRAWMRYDSLNRAVAGSLIYSKDRPKVGNWREVASRQSGSVTTSTTTSSTTEAPIVPMLSLTFDDIANANLMVGDSSNVSDWNTFFDLPTYGNPFTSVNINGNIVSLIGGSGITFKDYVFGNNTPTDTCLLEVVDSGCIVGCNEGVFADYIGNGCYNLYRINLPACINLEKYVFADCLGIIELILPFDSYTILKEYTFDSMGYNTLGIDTLSFPNVVTVENNCFQGCLNVKTFDLPEAKVLYQNCFIYCESVTTFNLNSCTNLGLTVGSTSVFSDITEQTITLTIPAALMTCNAGTPDGDIQYLVANNTVTVIQV